MHTIDDSLGDGAGRRVLRSGNTEDAVDTVLRVIADALVPFELQTLCGPHRRHEAAVHERDVRDGQIERWKCLIELPDERLDLAEDCRRSARFGFFA